ncbi:trehalose-phosphatase, partial [candidate division FCPU426 bacterium]|nr:trehalose-phosphatase [candidate division FCPU426 bacterium]
VKGKDKGTSVTAVRAGSPADTFTAYLGDDRTDEDAFLALAGRGAGILVRKEFRKTQAQYWLKPPEELLEFLRHWRDAG